jgi:uncharacterized protein YjbI with pentapeptide repeats
MLRMLNQRQRNVTRTALLTLLTLIALVGLSWLISRIAWPEWTGFNPKTFWDVLELVIVPLAFAGGAFWLNQQQKQRELEITEQQKQRELENARDAAEASALQTYIDRMSDLLLTYDLGKPSGPNVAEARSIAQARTNTVLRHLNPTRKGMLIRFLQESGLIAAHAPVVDLNNVDLIDIILTDADLAGASFSGAYLMRARLAGANLSNANLSGALLHGALLSGATLSGANLSNTDLKHVSNMVGVRYDQDTIWPDGFTPPVNFKDAGNWTSHFKAPAEKLAQAIAGEHETGLSRKF